MTIEVYDFLGAIFEGTQGLVELRPLPESPGASMDVARKGRRWMSAGEAEDKADAVAEWCRSHGHGAFFGVLPRMNAESGTKDNIAPGRVTWVDLDYKDYEGGEPEARRLLDDLGVPPSALVNTGHGLHAYWLLTDLTDPEAIEVLNTGLRDALKGDDVQNFDRILRLPGSWNLKDPEDPRQVVIEHLDPDHRIHPSRLPAPRATRPAGKDNQRSKDLPPEQAIEGPNGVVKTAAEWAKGLQEDEKVQCHCPFAGGKTTLGSAFLQRYEANLLFCCTSRNHGHDTPYKALMRLDGDGRARTESSGGTDVSGKQDTQAQRLVGLADDAELFHSPEEEGFALLTVDGHRECWPIRERGFRQWMSARYFHSEGKPPAAQALQDALNLLNARANHEGPEVPVSVRIAEHEGCVYLDLCNPSWEAVCIGADGWRIDPDPPVRFRRSRLSKALPRPEQHGSLDALRKLVNLPDDDAWRLAVGFLLGAMNPSGPYPLLVVQGEQGSAKSSLCRILRTVLDPSVVALRSPPREERDLAIAARSAWLLGFDNLSAVKDGLSDALCRLSTGGGFGTRKLYSDADEVVFAEMRPAILNGIPDLLTRPDLSDRAVVLHLKAISDDQRCSEKDLWERFEAAHPQVLGGLCDAVSGILRDREGLSLPVLPRMADFAAWVTAAEPALEWEPGSFVEIYKRCRSDRVHAAIGEDPVAQALLELAEQLPEWSGTATQLLGVLTERVGERAGKSRDWPKSAKSLANRLRRLAPDLRTVGLNVIDPQEAGRQPGTGARLWNLRRMDL